MDAQDYIKSTTDESLVSELEVREKKGPLTEGLKERLATMIGAFRPKVQGVIPLVNEVRGPLTAPDAAPELHVLSPLGQKALLSTLQPRFERHPEWHEEVPWERVKKALEANPLAMWSIQKLEESGGEPTVFRVDKEGFEIGDCSTESPYARRNCSFDMAEARAIQWGVKLYSREQYEFLHTKGKFDEVIQSWIETPIDLKQSDGRFMRQAGGALCGYLHVTGVYVGRGDALDQREDRSFRCALRVEWVKEKSKTSFWKKLIKKDKKD